jgi:hypothetical protein
MAPPPAADRLVARDRSTEYARGTTLGAAVQVANRWHLLLNSMCSLPDTATPEKASLKLRHPSDSPIAQHADDSQPNED